MYMIHQIKINTEFIKLDSFLKLAGITETGGQAKQKILSQQIKVNNKTCEQRGKKLYHKDKIEVDNIEYEVITHVG